MTNVEIVEQIRLLTGEHGRLSSKYAKVLGYKRSLASIRKDLLENRPGPCSFCVVEFNIVGREKVSINVPYPVLMVEYLEDAQIGVEEDLLRCDIWNNERRISELALKLKQNNQIAQTKHEQEMSSRLREKKATGKVRKPKDMLKHE